MGGNQGVYPGKAAGPEQTVQECARAGPSRAAGKAGAGGDILCAADRLPVESGPAGVWVRQQHPPVFPGVAGSGLF